ncbi:TonB-dependent receptor [Chitinophaga silvatica]|uniref:TonB-dependent receptor n=1 Tax=Chitinophaga silvatica TaxID=2282649 RepID=A0A3E1Y3R2_9BACT|nr:TonB-dependent receptor [Chitinophaga silvatica]RFS19340.1 TonB-dependent receptor [Chitinophaga silvatica]
MEKNKHRSWVMLCFILLGICGSLPSLAQNKIKVSGTVLDSAGSSPIPGVSIQVQGTKVATQTKPDGKFTIEADPNGVLIFSFIGYGKQTVAINNKTSLLIRLSSTDQKLNEVVVLAYGQQKKVAVTGAVASVSGKDLRQSSSASLTGALAGRLPGLSAVMASGQPGRDDATLYLRGASTVNGKDPLILIDGVPRDNLRTLDANEVESISILKDASATAVFGVRGANGVILITTRRGSPGKTELSFSLDQSMNSFTTEPGRIHSLEYMEMYNRAAANDKLVSPYTEKVMEKFRNPLAGLDPNDPDYEKKKQLREYIYPDHDYFREYISKYSPQTRANLNLTGGTDKATFFANFAYIHQGGNLKTEPKSQLGYDPSVKMDRFNFRANLDYKLTNSLKAILNIASYIEKVNMPSSNTYPGSSTDWMINDIMYQARTIRPFTPGPLTLPGYGAPENAQVYPDYLDRSAFEVINRQGFRNELRSNLNSTLGVEWDLSKLITKGLTIKGMISYDAKSTSAMQGSKYEPLYLAYVNYDKDELTYGTKKASDDRLSIGKAVDSRYNINMQASINYNRTFGKHSVGGMFLGQRDFWEASDGVIPFNVIGMAGRAQYNYDNRYFAEFDMGYNGSEQFAPKKRYGFFPAVSGAYVISNENFLKGNDILSLLKLRASYGKVGSDKISDTRFLYQSDITTSTGGGPLSGSIAGTVNQKLLGNENITWETAVKQNYGVDFELFKNLTVTFDYFFENRKDILITRGMVPVIQGVPLGYIPKVNMGVVDNQGYELEVTYRKNLTKDLYVRLTGNYSRNNSIVRNRDEAMRSDDYAYRYRATGFRLNQNFGYKIDYSNGNGYFNTQKELDEYLAHTTYSFGKPGLGDFKYIDLNGDGVIDAKDVAPVKYSNIPGTVYGANLNLGFKGWELTIFFQGVGRFSSQYGDQGVYENTKEGSYYDYHKTAWTPERYAAGEKITYPALHINSNPNQNANDFFIQDRSYLRLRTLELAYNLPANWLKPMRMKAIRVYIGAQNPFLWSNLHTTHLDPENSSPLAYTITKTYNIGLSTTF